MSTAKEQLEKWDKLLDEYEKSIGLPPQINNQEDIEKYLSMNRNELEKLSPEDCAQIAYILSSYGLYTQKCHNREQARVNWAKSTLKQAIADEVQKYNKYAPYEERSEQAIKHNEYAQKVHQILLYAESRALRLTYMSNHIKNLTDILLSLQRAKNGRSQ